MIDNQPANPERVFDNEDIIKNLRELTIGSKTAGIFMDKYGSRWGNADFSKANAWIKTDGTYSFKKSDGSVVLDKDGVKADSIEGGVSIFGWSSTVYFQSMDEDTIDWQAGKIKLADGTEFEIEAGSTGNFTGQVYIYIDTQLSTTELQTTTDGMTPVGLNKILVAVGKDAPSGQKASLQVFGGAGGMLVGGDNILKGSIRGFDHILANTIGAGELSTGLLITQHAQIGSEVVQNSHIQDLSADKITVGTLRGIDISGGVYRSLDGRASMSSNGEDFVFTCVKDYNFYADGVLSFRVGSHGIYPMRGGYDLGADGNRFDKVHANTYYAHGHAGDSFHFDDKDGNEITVRGGIIIDH